MKMNDFRIQTKCILYYIVFVVISLDGKAPNPQQDPKFSHKYSKKLAIVLTLLYYPNDS